MFFFPSPPSSPRRRQQNRFRHQSHMQHETPRRLLTHFIVLLLSISHDFALSCRSYTGTLPLFCLHDKGTPAFTRPQPRRPVRPVAISTCQRPDLTCWHRHVVCRHRRSFHHRNVLHPPCYTPPSPFCSPT